LAAPTRAGGRAGQGGDGGLRHLEQLARGGLLADPLALQAVVQALGLAAGVAAGHALHVAAGAEALAGPGHHDAAHRRLELGPGELLAERAQHVAGEGVARLGAVQRQRQHAAVLAGQKVGGSGVDVGHGLHPFLLGGDDRPGVRRAEGAAP
jgi:hypothetical protein